ncbi:MAG: c-type cytochrome biogenesis protein CcmI, partial [Chromatiales bacterium]|nr:c-type cytochrome biogenesis protein CcmI [Chromatiales bacterium]
MTIFWMGAAVILLGALAWILPALWRPDEEREASRDDHVVLAYETRSAELEIDRDEGVVDEEQYAVARDELARELLNDTGMAETSPARTTPAVTASVVTVAVAALTVGLYLHIGAPSGLGVSGKGKPQGPSAAQVTAHDNAGEAMPSVEKMVTSLAERLKKDPSDGEGWMMLGRSYVVLGRLEDARAALEKAYKLSPANPDMLAAY